MTISTALVQLKNADQFRKLTLKSAKVLAPVNKIAHRYGPEILTGVGIASGIAAAVLGAKATLKLEETVDNIKFEVDGLKEMEGVILVGSTEPEYSHAQLQRKIVKAKTVGALEIAKLYAPAVGVGVGSITCVLAAHGIMRRRNVALAAAYTAVEQSFASYRKRVVDEYGKEKDQDFRHGLKDVKKTDKETGKTHTETVITTEGISVYARFFDEVTSTSWSKTPGHNVVLIRAVQNYMNEKLNAFGYVFLNEAYEALGMERTRAGAVVGWILGPDNDNYIDFGIYDPENERKRMFVNGTEKNILLDFNVDGYIQDKI